MQAQKLRKVKQPSCGEANLAFAHLGRIHSSNT
jgi:hypothetical protein